MRWFLSTIIAVIFVCNLIIPVFAHKCFDCSRAVFKSSCCVKNSKPDSIKSECSCCSKERDNQKSYYTVNLKYEINVNLYVDVIIKEATGGEENITDTDIPPRYGGILKLPRYKEVNHFII